MKGKLEEFIRKIPEFDSLTKAEQIKYFVFYLSLEGNLVTPSEVANCFNILSLVQYSNIPAYMSRYSKGKNQKFIKRKEGYSLTRSLEKDISLLVNDTILLPPSNSLIDMSIVENTRYYIVATSDQLNKCYDLGLYDACLVMIRKLIETLIIECFEKHNNDTEIKDSHNNFYYLSDLISIFIDNKKWNVSRNLRNNMKQIKKYGDLSAHNRRFMAKKSDLDSLKDSLRQVFQEIILLTQY